ncbi:PPE family protein [Mycobacterium sp.]|uniref:PPE family protein n=1 Tax=Mycobacterium sp. TaxID=1785 RepID=UPI003A8C2500
MTSPVWMAVPPEVHSTLLSSGPGPGPLLAAAAQWAALSAEYTETAAELAALLAAVEGGAWGGPSAAQFAAAHGPFLAWLAESSTESAAAAVRHETAAAAYTTALAAMPTLVELAANRTLLGTLVTTNFFGINTIPIAVTEADYMRMWIQAATVMSVYQGISTAAVASAQPAGMAPRIVDPLAAEAAAPGPDTITILGCTFNDPIAELLSGSEHFSSMWAVLKALILNPVATLSQLVADFAASPATAVVTWLPLFYMVAYAFTFALMGTPMYAAAASPALILPLALSFAGFTEVPAESATEVPAGIPAGVAPQRVVAVAVSSPPATTAGGALAAPAPAPQVPATTGAPAATAAAGAPAFPYLVAGPGPGPVFGPNLTNRASASAPASTIPAAAAAAAAGSKAKTRRRRRAGITEKGHRDEYMTLDDTPAAADTPWGEQPPETLGTAAASNAGAGPLGFTGTATKTRAGEAAGLTTLAGDQFGNGPEAPMMPTTWQDAEDDPRPRPQ